MGIIKPRLGTIPHRAHPRYLGCVGHWVMNEGAGLSAYDFSGNGNHGTLTGGPTWNYGQYGTTVNFSGTNDYISIPNSSSLQFGTGLTVSFWHKYVGTPAQYREVLGKVTDNSKADGFAFYYDSATVIRFHVSAKWHAWATITPTVWNHIVGTYNLVTTIYINGVSVMASVAASGSIINSATVLQLGRLLSNSYNIIGQLDDVRIYNRALPAGEIASLYQDPFLEFREVPRRYSFVAAAAGLPAGGLGLLGVGR